MEMVKQKVAVIGTGSLGKTIAGELPKHLGEYYELVGLMKHSESGIKELEEQFQTPVVTDLGKLLELEPDFVVEAASVDVVKEHGEKILSKGIHFIPLSVGGLVEEHFYKKMQKTAKANDCVLYIPSGAIGGLDMMRKMALSELPKVSITTTKPPSSLQKSPYLDGRKLSDTEKEVVFDGSAAEAIKGFPSSINVAVATALATVGPEETRTIIKSDPEFTSNVHEISLENSESSVYLRFGGKPSDNPSSSAITAWSVISLLQNIAGPVRFF